MYSMHSKRSLALAAALALVGSVACRVERTPAAADGHAARLQPARPAGPALAPHPLPRAELAMFAALPPTMAGPGPAPTPAQIALGRALFHDTRLSDGHDVSCHTCHSLNGSEMRTRLLRSRSVQWFRTIARNHAPQGRNAR